MIRRAGATLARFFRAVTPDPFVLAIGLTVVTGALALLLRPVTITDVTRAWQGGFWNLLAFSMQMCLVLVTGHALASAPVVGRLIARIVALPKTAAAAGATVAVVAILTGLLNWGLGLIVGALLAREMGRNCANRGVRVQYPLLAAAGYTGLLVWHGGFSGSAPLKVTTTKDLVELLGADLAATVTPVSTFDTILSPMNLFVSGGLLIIVPLVVYLLTPKPADPEIEISTIEDFPAARFEADDDAGPDDPTWPERIERSPVTTALLAVPLLYALALYYREAGVSRLDPNAVNLTLLTLGLILHKNPRAYVRAVGRAVSGCAGIILQFPLYAGIMGMMAATGLAKLFAAWAAGLGSAGAYSVVTFSIAGLINFFVPSGGGQWAVQGPIAVQAAAELGVPLSQAVMAVAYGDEWTNMLQPFWALPLLGLTGLKARQIMGYCMAVMLVGFVPLAAALLVM